jgi:predicted ArsR family transcriptional regulator
VTLPERNHELLARLLAETAATSAENPPTNVANRYGRSLGARARKRISSRASSQRLGRCVSDVLEDLAFEPVVSDAGDVWARNCPFDPLSRQYPAVVCQTAIELVRGVVEGVGPGVAEVRREERPDRCCVVLSPPTPG